MQEPQETRIWSLSQEDPLEEGMATHSSILAQKIPGTEEPGGLQSTGYQRVGYNWSKWAHTHKILDINGHLKKWNVFPPKYENNASLETNDKIQTNFS